MNKTQISTRHADLEEIAVRQLTEAVRNENSTPERITALATALSAASSALQSDVQTRHFLSTQEMMMQAQLQQLMQAQAHAQQMQGGQQAAQGPNPSRQ